MRAKAERGEAIEPMFVPVKVTITIDNQYDILNEQITHNVVGLVEGSDPALKNTYVLFGAHLDHIGYSQTGTGRGAATNACRQRSAAAQAAVLAAGKTVQRPTPAPGAAESAVPARIGRTSMKGATPAHPGLLVRWAGWSAAVMSTQ